jgi:integrase
MAKTKKTKIDYYNRSCSLMMKAYDEAMSEDHAFSDKKIILKYKDKKQIMMDVRYAAIWAVKYWSPNLLQSAWKYYRCSLTYMAELLNSKQLLKDDELEKLKTLLKTVKGKNKIEIDERRTSSNKKKSFNKKEVREMDEELKISSNNWSNPLRLWIRAGKYTGLRPIEWSLVTFNEETNELIVMNAKNTNGRSLGDTRTMSLSHLKEDQINDILLHLKISNQMMDTNNWEKYYKGCSNLLRYTARKIWPRKDRYPTLYSCRHQFSADMKASGCTKKEVAALMGHGSDLTAQEHYGRKVHGTRGRKPDVNKNDLRRVRDSDKQTYKFDNKNNNNN